jgi:hypothetical protein
MSFSEKVKLIAKRKSAFRCCICYKPFVEVHHIVPQSEGGPDTLNNAATLCSSCHDLYGGNPEKRKTIKQMRDHWWEMMSKRELTFAQSKDLDENCIIEENQNHTGNMKSKSIALYHLVFAHEDFETAANHLFELITHAQTQWPNQNRVLFLKIEGHRNKKGGFDRDMFELQKEFMIVFLCPFLAEVYMPLGRLINPCLQDNGLPEKFDVIGKVTNEKITKLMSSHEVFSIYIADKGKWLKSE